MSSKLFFLPHKLFFSNRDSGLSDMYFNNVQEKILLSSQPKFGFTSWLFLENQLVRACPPSQPEEGASRQTRLLLMKRTASEIVET